MSPEAAVLCLLATTLLAIIVFFSDKGDPI